MVGCLVMVTYSGCGAEIRPCSVRLYPEQEAISRICNLGKQTYRVVMCPLARWQSYGRAGVRRPRAHILNSGM